MEVVEPNKKQNHGVMLAITAEDINGTIVRIAADEGLFTYLAGCQDGGMMGMGLAQMGKSKTGINYLKSTIQSIRPSLVNNALFMFHVGEPLRCIDEGNMALPPNKWAVVKQIEEVPPNVMDVLVLRFPKKLRSSTKQKKKDGSKSRTNGNIKNQRGGKQNNSNPSRNSKKIVPITTGKKKKRLFLIRKKRERKVVAIATKPKRTPPTTNRVVTGKRAEGNQQGKMAVAATTQRKVMVETAVNLAVEVTVLAGVVEVAVVAGVVAGVGVAVEDEAVVEEETGEGGKSWCDRPVYISYMLKY